MYFLFIIIYNITNYTYAFTDIFVIGQYRPIKSVDQYIGQALTINHGFANG